MKKRKRILCALMAAMMLLALVPAPALATGSSPDAPQKEIYLGGEQEANENTNGVTGDAEENLDAAAPAADAPLAEVTSYDLWVSGVRVTSENMHDVLNNGGSVVFTPAADGEPNTLTLTDANITGMWISDTSWVAGIYGDIDLTLELVGKSSITVNSNKAWFNAGICMLGRELTVTGDGSLSIEALYGLENRGIEAASVIMQSGTLNVTSADSRTPNHAQATSLAVAAALTVNGGSLTATAGAAKNGSYGISDNSVTINGGRVIASGQVGAYRNAPDLSGYTGREVKVSANANGASASNWNGTDALTGFKYVKIAPPFANYDLWVSGVRVTSENMYDVLNNGGKVRFIPAANGKPHTLKLTNASISGPYSNTIDPELCAGIYGKLDLTLELVGENFIVASNRTALRNVGIYMSGRELTVTGDGSLKISAVQGMENYGIEARHVVMQSGTVEAQGERSRDYQNEQSASCGINASLTVNGGYLYALAGVAARNRSRGIMGDTIKINGGTVEAFGVYGAYKNAPDYSGYADAYITVGNLSSDAVPWNGTTALTLFNYVKIAPSVKYDLWVGSVRVTELNMRDVLNNGGSVVFTPAAGDKPSTLKLTNASITGEIDPAGIEWCAGIYGDIDLTLELVGTNSITVSSNAAWFNAGIRMRGRELTVTGDGSLTISALRGRENRGIEAERVLMQSGTLNVTSADSRTPNGDGSTSYAVAATLTVNGGSLTATAGAAKNGSYGIIGSPIKINGGTVEASGQVGAYRNAPDLSGYAEPAVKVSANADGADAAVWNGTDALTGFKYVRVAPPVSYDLWVGSVRVTELNMHDVLNNGGSVAFTPAANGKPNTLTLTDANIRGGGGGIETDYWQAGIYSKLDLTLELVGTNSITADSHHRWFNAGIAIRDGRKLTVTGDGSLNISALRGIENRGIEAESVVLQSGTVTVTSADSRDPTDPQATSHAVNGALTVNGGTLTATAGAAANGSYGVIGSSVTINGGRVIASGQSGAYRNAPDLSGYDEPAVKVSASADGADAAAWNETDALTGFKYVSIAPALVKYDLWIGGVRVTELNMHDVLGDDGSVVFTPAANGEPNTLTLTNASITGAIHPADPYWCAGIYGDIDLTLELVGTNSITADDYEAWFNAGIRMLGRELTVTGDGSLSMSVLSGVENRGVEAGSVVLQSGTVTVTSADSREPTDPHATSHAVNAALTVNGGSLTATAGAGANGSYGIIGSPVTINGGTVIASGQTGAFNNAPDLSGYAEPAVKVSASADGADAAAWNGTAALTGFKYVSIAPPLVEYGVWVGGVQVTSKNMHDVLGDDGSVVFTPAAGDNPHTLTLTDASITGADLAVDNEIWNVGIANGMHLTLELKGSSTVTAGNAQAPVSAGLFAGEESITVVGDGTLTVTGGSAQRVSAGFVGRALYVKKGAVIAKGGSAAESFGVYANSLEVVNNGTVVAEGGSAAKSIGVMAYYMGMTAGCTVVASGQTAALPSQELGYSFDYDFGGDFVVTVSANADGSDAQIWEAGTTPFNDSRFKYVSIAPPLVEYGVWVGGVQVTSKNRRDVFGDAAENGGTPTVAFTPAANGEPNTLTLTNASITGAQIPGMFTDYSYGIYSSNEQTDLRLELVGENTVTGADTRLSYGIMLANDSKLTIAEKGVGSLTASGGEAIRYSCGVSARWLVVESGTVRAYGGKADDYSRGAYVHLTLNGGYFSAVGGEAENSYGLQNYTTFTKAHHSITGGTLEACGNSGALASDISGEQNLHWAIPDFYGYGEPYVKVSMSADGANAEEWNGTTALTNFNYVKILPHIVRYDLWIGGVRVTSENMRDVLNNGGSVVFTPAANGKPNTLTLTDANIRGGGGKETEYWVAGIYGKLDLTLELVGTNTIKSNMNAYWFSAGICMLGRELTVTGDGSLRIEALSGMENRGVEAASVIMQSGTVNIISGDSSEPNYPQATSHAVNGALTVNGGSLTATAGAAANGSYGIIGSPIKINGGTVEASGQTGAFNNAPDLSGYADREVKVSASADGANAADWNGTDALTGFKYVRISPPVIDYGVLVGDVEVTSENMHDVFGDADKNGGTPTVRFTPAANGKPHKLTLTNANIVGAANFAVAAILAEGVDLELELCGENRIYMPTRAGYIRGIYLVAGDLTVSGDGSLDITMGEVDSDYDSAAAIECEKVTVESGTVRAFGGKVGYNGMSFGVWTGRLVINGGSLTAVGGDAQESFGVALWEVAEKSAYSGKDRDEEYIPAGSGLVINGGTLEARGKTAALNKSPDLSGYDEPYVTAGISVDGYGAELWNGEDALTDFHYVKIAPEPIVEYDLWISGVRVTEQNMGNILGETKNGTPTASFDPETNTLTLNDIEITREGMHTVDNLTSGIFADGMELRIEGSGKMSLSDDCQFSVLMWNRNGEDSLTLCGDFDFRGGIYGLDVHGNLVFEGGAVKAHNIYAGSVYFRGGTVDAYSNHEAFYAVKGLRGIELDRLMRIELPVDGQIVRYDTTGNVGYVIEGGESWTEHVRIAPRPKAETEIELSCEPLTCSPGETVTVTLTLREKNGRLIRGAEVELDIDAIGIYPLLRTDADGTATYSFIAPAEGGLWMTASYAGDAMRNSAWANAVVYITSETVTVRLHDPVGVVPEGTSLIVPKGIEGGSIFWGQNEWLVHIGDQAPEMYFFRGWELLEEQPQPESRGEQAMVHIEEEDSWKNRPVTEDIDLVAIWEEYPIIESISLMLDTRIAGLSAAEISAEALLSTHLDAPYYIYTSASGQKPTWRDADGNDFTGVFETGKTYRVSAWIQTYEDSAYRFLGWKSGEKLPLYLNGEAKAWDGTNYGTQIYVSVPFTPLPQDQDVAEVDSLEIELLYAAPRVGEPIPVMPNVRVNGAEAIVVNTRMMMQINGAPVTPPANTYGVGRYAVEITLAPNLRYDFAKNVTVDIVDMNGKRVRVVIPPNPDGTLTFYGQSHEAIESELFAIAVRGGTASAARAAAGERVTLTADEAENGYEFVRWQVNYPETLELEASASPVTSFIMPEGEVSVTAVFERLGNITLALTDDEGGAPVEFAVHKILRWKGMDHASTGEPTEYGYDPTDTGSALSVLSGGAPVPYSDEVAYIVLDMLMNAEYARYTQNGFGELSLRGGEGAREFVLVGVVNGVDTELMSVTVGERGGYVHAEVCSLAPGFVRMTLDGTEYAFATPGDVNLDGRMNAIDWISIMHWTLQGSTEDDTKPSDSAFEIKLNEETYNLWILLADMTGTDTGGSAVSSNWNTMVNAVDWITIMQLTLQAWKE